MALKGILLDVLKLTPVASAPKTANGIIYFDSVAGKPKGYRNGEWVTSS